MAGELSIIHKLNKRLNFAAIELFNAIKKLLCLDCITDNLKVNAMDLSAILFVKTLPKSIAKSIDAIFQYTLFDTVKLCNGCEV